MPLEFLRSFRVRLAFFFILAMAAAAASADFLIYRYALRSQFEQLRQKLSAVAQTAASAVDVPALQAIPQNKEGIDSPQYQQIAKNLNKIKDAVAGIKYIYILAYSGKPGILKFIVDAEAGEADTQGPQTYPGYEYDATRFPEMVKGFEGPAADRTLEKDEWGVFLSGYAPIRDASGKAVAILGVDMRAEDVYSVQKEVRKRAVSVFILGLGLAIIFSFFISAGVSRRIRELTRGVDRLAQGDFDHRIAEKGDDELARLIRFFNKMSGALKFYMEELRRTTAEKERLVKEIEIARGIQQSFLPAACPEIEGFEIAAVNLPARMVGGDFYDFIPIEKDKWGLVIADVSGKGVPAALFMALSRTLVRASASVTLSPDQALNRANDLILQDAKTNMFVTLFYAVLDAKMRTLKYANAGHNPALHVRGGASDIVLLKAQTMPLGIMSDIRARTEEIALQKGDVILLYTDGVTEAVNENKAWFDMERLETLTRNNRHLSAQVIIRKVQDEVADFVGNQPQFDDITLMVIKVV